MFGPIFERELAVAPRRPRLYVVRSLYAFVLLVLMCTAWLVLTGTQVIRNTGDFARFGAVLFQVLSPFQIAVVLVYAAFTAASSIAQEKDRKTFILLLMTRMSNAEIVAGKLFSSLTLAVVMVVSGLPVFAATVLFGGVSFSQVIGVFAVSLATLLVAGSLGTTIALWRDKTFQSLAVTALLIVAWLAAAEVIGSGVLGDSFASVTAESVATAMSPFRAVLAAASPFAGGGMRFASGSIIGLGGIPFISVAAAAALLLLAVSIRMIRVWNPTREVRGGKRQQAQQSIVGVGEEDESAVARAESGTTPTAAQDRLRHIEAARDSHVDARLPAKRAVKHRTVWDNPILWREVCTWAYGKKVLAVRLGYVVMCALAVAAAYYTFESTSGAGNNDAEGLAGVIPHAARPLTPFLLLSVVITNALAVTSITTERDGKSLDLLLVTDLSPREFVFGKLLGVFYVTKEMVVAPWALCVLVWAWDGMTLESLIYVLLGLMVIQLFVATLGIHCGMTYGNSRTAIGVSLGTVFFLFLGVVTCMLIMISFSGSFESQLAPFAAFILGGGAGLYVSLGLRNPSPAIALASLTVPLATFYAITSFLLAHTLDVFLVTTAAYGFTTLALLIPAIYEFDVEMGRTSGPQEQ